MFSIHPPERQRTHTENDTNLIQRHKKTIKAIQGRLSVWENTRNANGSTQEAVYENEKITRAMLFILSEFDGTLTKNWSWKYTMNQAQREFLHQVYGDNADENTSKISLLKMWPQLPKVIDSEFESWADYIMPLQEDLQEKLMVGMITCSIGSIILSVKAMSVPAMLPLATPVMLALAFISLALAAIYIAPCFLKLGLDYHANSINQRMETSFNPLVENLTPEDEAQNLTFNLN
ncbi:MAG: hypothetical protein P1U36_09320 [Legionellaceae bacterium]|nr:hypothetical protein [Legionellaceae bacterium]